MAPLDLTPEWVQQLAYSSPFPWMVAFPVDLILGKLTLDECLEGLLFQFFWTMISLGFVSVVWRRGIRAYSAVGS